MEDKDLLEKAWQEHINLLKELDELRVMNIELKQTRKLLKEVVNRFCDPKLLRQANEWIDNKYLH